MTDFGLGAAATATATGRSRTRVDRTTPTPSEIAGTLDYMAPEQRSGGDVDAPGGPLRVRRRALRDADRRAAGGHGRAERPEPDGAQGAWTKRSAGRTRGWTSGSRRREEFAKRRSTRRCRRRCRRRRRCRAADRRRVPWRRRSAASRQAAARSAASGRAPATSSACTAACSSSRRPPLPAVRRVPGPARPVLHLLRRGGEPAGRGVSG